MQPINVSNPQSPEDRWHALGVLELSLDSDVHGALKKWLEGLLAPLHLTADFTHKILLSAQDSITRAQRPHANVTFSHLHFSIFILHDHSSKGNTWGFFRIEKIDSAEFRKEHPNHAVELYLYREGA